MDPDKPIWGILRIPDRSKAKRMDLPFEVGRVETAEGLHHDTKKHKDGKCCPSQKRNCTSSSNRPHLEVPLILRHASKKQGSWVALVILIQNHGKGLAPRLLVHTGSHQGPLRATILPGLHLQWLRMSMGVWVAILRTCLGGSNKKCLILKGLDILWIMRSP